MGLRAIDICAGTGIGSWAFEVDRLKALGNAWVPQVAMVVAERIKQATTSGL